MTGRMLSEIEKELIEEKPDHVLVYGDTNSTLAGALAAAKLNIPISHVEAGLRSFNSKMPEEINRVLVDSVSSYLFCPTETAVDNLRAEGRTENVFNVGDVMYDASLIMTQKAETSSTIIKSLCLQQKPYILVTIHRAENTNDILLLQNILEFFTKLSKLFRIVFPIHPRTKFIIGSELPEDILGDITIIDPVSYFDMMCLQRNAYAVITDSGGVQKEAFFNKVPCVTFRTETEWVETVECGCNVLVNPYKLNSIDVNQFIDIIPDMKSSIVNPYGDGKASTSIADVLAR
jgi:UDP-GlcNAc3NAcA epimerase